MSNFDESGMNPTITIEWDIWNETWILNRTLIYSERYNVPVNITLRPGSMTVVLEVIAHAANLIEVGLFIGIIVDYLRRKTETKKLPQPTLNQDATVADAISHLTFFEKRDITNFKVKCIRKIDNGYEVIFSDAFSNIFRFEIYYNGTYEYFKQ
jgi:hypothetical protein